MSIYEHLNWNKTIENCFFSLSNYVNVLLGVCGLFFHCKECNSIINSDLIHRKTKDRWNTMYTHRFPSHSGYIPAPCRILFIYLFLTMECIIRWKLILKFQLLKTKWSARRHYHWWSQFVWNCKAYVTDVKREAFLCHILCCLHR